MSIVTTGTRAFDLPDRLSAKREPARIEADEAHFQAIAECREQSVSELVDRLAIERRSAGGIGQQAMDRDIEIHRLTARLRVLRRFTLDACLGRIVTADDPEPLYIGRFGLTDRDGRRLLIDWRAPAAAPFFAATLAHPLGVVSRRRYRWTRGLVSDYWDEVFSFEEASEAASPDDQSAFIASLGQSRSPRMRDVLGTIQADQDAVIRAGSRGALVVDGGPGTGKTVVALHRAAYLLYSDPRLDARRGGVLVVGPHQPYLAYVSDVLPNLGEEGVQTCTLRDLVVEGAGAVVEADADVARLKESLNADDVIARAVKRYEQPPRDGVLVETPWADVWLSASDWAVAFDAAEPDASHNDAREQVWDELIAIAAEGLDDEVPSDRARSIIAKNADLRAAFSRAWPLLDPAGIVADLWAAPDYLRECAPVLDDVERGLLWRTRGGPWTDADLPLLDAARQRFGDPEAEKRAHLRAAALAADQEQRDRVIDDLIAADDSELLLMSMLRGQDTKNSLVDEDVVPRAMPDLLAGPFAHIVVDEAQELNDAQWQMLLRRCPSRSFTIVGDRAQARHGFTETWIERLERVGLRDIHLASLTINYRTPEEVMEAAEPMIRAELPDANVPTSIRRSGRPVRRGVIAELSDLLGEWLDTHPDGVACVIGDETFAATDRVSSLTPELAKGLEFDLVIVVDPAAFGAGIEGTVDRYVSMTRATEQLVILD
ncbi:AAA family ATPase [Agromyces atrinae]|uniref:AAA family ATPase n=1 Tax=Agromyces atrinae TaxID=592376 RepID=A0A4Q2MBL9_9MICO|nr:AAA family ATPase [Agromyces atrinae]